MLPEKLIKTLKKQHYEIVGNHSGVQVCRWTKKSLINEGECYKEQFYGIKSHRCCQMSPSVGFCQNQCLHCWRAIELTIGTEMSDKIVDEPEQIIRGCILAQQKLLSGFNGNSKVDKKKLKEAQEPTQFAISLTGEPTLYPKLGDLVEELRKQKKSTFIVTNGLQPEVLENLGKKHQLPTQLYISLNTPNEKMFNEWHRSKTKNAWQVFNKSLEIFPKLKTRKVIRMTLVKEKNMFDEFLEDYANLIKKANPDFVEVKGYMSVGFARQRMGYETMPTHKDIQIFTEKLKSKLGKEWKILDEHEHSRVVLIGKEKSRMKIKKEEI
jgi:tRNA wybutosine-synthesizing protein 1